MPPEEQKKWTEDFEMTRERISITADKIILHYGHLTSQEMTYTREGKFLLGKATKANGEVMLYPFHVADQDTVYGQGWKLILNEMTTTPNQTMQLTAKKSAIYAGGVCRRARMLRFMHRGLAAADLVSR